MSKKKPIWIFVVIGVIVLITGLTIFINRVILPVQIKNIAITQAKNFLKRNVEIGNLRFSWVKGLMVDDVRIYQKDSTELFFQSRRISVGIIFIPGFKQHQLTIPFVDVLEPEVHLSRQKTQEWNFSDLLTPPVGDNKTSNIKFSLLGVNIIDGHIIIDDKSSTAPFHQDLEAVNVKVGLGLNGIAIDARANLSKTNGLFNIQGTYQPLAKSLDAHVYLKNIRPAQYLSLVPAIPNITLTDALLKEINVDTHYDANLFSVKGDINAAEINVQYGTINIAGNLEANINQCDIKKGSINIDASVNATKASLSLSPSQVFKGNVTLEKVKIRQDKDGTQLVGTISGQNLDALFNGQTLRGDFLARPITVEMKNENDIDVKGDFKSSHIEFALNDQQSFSGKVGISDAHLHLTDKKDITFDGKIALDDLDLKPMTNMHAAGSIDLKNVALTLKSDILNVKTKGELNNWQINLDKDKSIVAEAAFSVDATCPIKEPKNLTYAGTFEIQHADVSGYPFGPFNAIAAKGDFKTDQISIKLFSVVAMDSAFKGAATILNLKDPVLSVEIANESIDLSKLKDVIPDIYNQYGLDTKGSASFNASFEGLVSAPLSGKINIKAQLQGVDVASSKFNQRASNITGTVEGTPDSLTWNNFSGTYLDKKYTLTGSLNNFKSPKIKTTLNGDDIKIDTDIEKKNNDWSINKLVGKYFDIVFDASGKISMPENKPPVLDIQTSINTNIEKILPLFPADQRKVIEPLGITGDVALQGHVGGSISDWKNLASNATIKSNHLTIMGYHIDDLSVVVNQQDGKLSNSTIDAIAYTGKIHSVVNLDLNDAAMPFDIALNVDGLDMQGIKKDIPSLNGKEIKGKFYLTTVGKGKATDITNISAKGSLAIREGFLTEFKIFEGLLGILNEAMRLGQLTITDVDGNFTIENKKITTQNLRLISPTIVLLTEGWIDLDQMCDLNVSVDMTSGVIPPVAEQVLRTLSIHIYDKITAPKFTKKISVPQVLNSIIKTIGIFQ